MAVDNLTTAAEKLMELYKVNTKDFKDTLTKSGRDAWKELEEAIKELKNES